VFPMGYNNPVRVHVNHFDHVFQNLLYSLLYSFCPSWTYAMDASAEPVSLSRRSRPS
jgi:hypothetical protein